MNNTTSGHGGAGGTGAMTYRSMVERVAAAIEEAWDEAANAPGAAYDTEVLARAAIAAMREPIDEEAIGKRAADVWRSMIDAALDQ